VSTLSRFTRLSRRFEGASGHIKIGAGKPEALAATVGLFVSVAQLLANGLQLARHR
jgi:hypothetical protein